MAPFRHSPQRTKFDPSRTSSILLSSRMHAARRRNKDFACVAFQIILSPDGRNDAREIVHPSKRFQRHHGALRLVTQLQNPARRRLRSC